MHPRLPHWSLPLGRLAGPTRTLPAFQVPIAPPREWAQPERQQEPAQGPHLLAALHRFAGLGQQLDHPSGSGNDERERIRAGVTGLPLDNAGRVDYPDLLAVIDGEASA